MLLLLLIPTFVLADRFSDHLENYVGHSGKPCEDFYAYMCPSNTARFFTHDLQLEFKNNTEEYLDKSGKAIWLSTLMTKPKEIDEKTGRAEMLRKCKEHGEQRFVKLLKTVRSSIKKFIRIPLSNPEKCDELYDYYMETQSFIKPNGEGDLGLFMSVASTFEDYMDAAAFEEYARQNPQISQSLELAREIATKIREFYYEELEKSTWLKEIKEKALSIMKKVYFLSPNLQKENTEYFKTLIKQSEWDYKECKKILNGISRNDYQVCFITVFGNLIVKQIGNDVSPFVIPPQLFNAKYNYKANFFVMAHALYAIDNLSIENKAGLYALIIGHELGHAIYGNAEINGHLPKNMECLITDMEETCKLFATNTCKSGNASYHEDSADWAAIRAALHLVETQPLKTTKLPDKKTILELWAYMWCSKSYIRKGSNGRMHSSRKIRVNAVMRQLPFFQEAFKCSNSDPQVAEEKCYLLGKQSQKYFGAHGSDVFV